MSFYIGIMSGTSLDGIDAVLVSINDKFEKVIAHIFLPFSDSLETKLKLLQKNGQIDFYSLGDTDRLLALAYAKATKILLEKTSIKSTKITAIGCHGQTIYHSPPNKKNGFTNQLGDPNTLAAETGISVIADFRRMDMAYGGQGAPLTPTFHAAVFANTKHTRIILNLGGISNITVLSPNKSIIGFDCGPANCLLDEWINNYNTKKKYDKNGEWAATGTVNLPLLNNMLQDPYFNITSPKSTGREYFNLKWLSSYLTNFTNETPVNIQATLCELTAITTGNCIKDNLTSASIIYICGGGAYNKYLFTRLKYTLQPHIVTTTQKLGLPVTLVESCAFAWLAHCRINKIPGNIPAVTGASKPAILGSIYCP